MSTTDAPQPSTNPRNLAANLRHIANLIESANLDELATPVSLSVSIGAYGAQDEKQKAVVDQIAAVTGHGAAWDKSSGGGEYAYYRTEMKHGRTWSLSSYAFIRRPDPAAELQAEVERLRAQLAELAAADVTRHPAGCGCTSCADIRQSVLA